MKINVGDRVGLVKFYTRADHLPLRPWRYAGSVGLPGRGVIPDGPARPAVALPARRPAQGVDGRGAGGTRVRRAIAPRRSRTGRLHRDRATRYDAQGPRGPGARGGGRSWGGPGGGDGSGAT